MLVSILIPTRDRLSFLRASLESARAQRAVDVEILVSDDGSTDATREYVHGVAAADPRVQLLTDNPVPGIFENVEHLIGRSRGQAFTVLGDDDLLDPDFCALLERPLAADPGVNLVFCDHRVIDARGKVLPRETRRSTVRYGRARLRTGPVPDPISLALNGGIWLGFTLCRRDAFPGTVFDPAAGTAADWDFAIKAARRGGVFYVAGRHGSYRDHGGTASRRRKRAASAAALQVLERHRFDDPRHEALRRKLLADRAKRHAYQFAALDRAAARRSLELYRRLGGGHSVHTAVAGALLRLPRSVGQLAQSAVERASRVALAARRRVAP